MPQETGLGLAAREDDVSFREKEIYRVQESNERNRQKEIFKVLHGVIRALCSDFGTAVDGETIYLT